MDLELFILTLFTMALSNTNTPGSLLPLTPSLPIANTKFSNDPTCSEKPLNKGSKIPCQKNGKKPKWFRQTPNGSKDPPDNKEKERQRLRKNSPRSDFRGLQSRCSFLCLIS
jgi:hypothetical protein